MMKARVLRPYFDQTGLHKPGEVVEVDQATELVEIIAEETKPEPKPEVKTKEKAEVKKPATKTTKSTNKVTKKKG